MNLVVISGRLGADPDMTYTPGGKAKTTFSIAVDGYENGQKIVTWFRVTCWERTAENVAQYCVKGSFVMVEGSIRVSQYKNGSQIKQMTALGVPRDKAEIVAMSNWYEISGYRCEFGPKSNNQPVRPQPEEVPTFDNGSQFDPVNEGSF